MHGFIKARICLLKSILIIFLLYGKFLRLLSLLQFRHPHASSSQPCMRWFLISGNVFVVLFPPSTYPLCFATYPLSNCTCPVNLSARCMISIQWIHIFYRFSLLPTISVISLFLSIVTNAGQVRYVLSNDFGFLSLGTHCSINKLESIDFLSSTVDATEPYE